MKRIHFRIEEELDDALAREAAWEGTSKSELVRQITREGLKVGVAEDEPDDSRGDADR